MKADTKEFWFAVLVTVIGLAAVLPAQTTAVESSEPAQTVAAAPVQVETPQTEATPAKPQRTILVSLQDRKLALIENGEVKVIYTVAVGKTSTPSPVGSFTVVSHVANPTYTHDGKVIGPGPSNPVGSRWMGLSEKGYGIHGTNVPSSIGKATSHGCIRLGKKDLEKLFTMVKVGDTVEIRGERDEEVAAVFGGEPQNNGASNGVMVAASAPAPEQVTQGQE